MKNNVSRLVACPYCKSKEDIEVFFECNKMPNIMFACPQEMLKKFRLLKFQASFCKKCSLGFNSLPMNTDELSYVYDNYGYISPFSNIGHTKYNEIINLIEKYTNRNEKIVEIGCSEGYILYTLQEHGYSNLLGIEPSPQAEIAKNKGINVVKSYFDDNLLEDGIIDCFILMHVFEHFQDPFAILRTMLRKLKPQGKIILEIPNFGGFRHDHLFFYTDNFFNKLAEDFSLKIIYKNANTVIRIVLTPQANSLLEAPPQAMGNFSTDRNLAQENFNKKVVKLNEIFKINDTIVWWGAGGTSVIFLNQVEPALINTSNLYVIDGDVNKWGTFLPGPNIEVKSYVDLSGKTIQTLVVASNFYNEIKQTLEKYDILVENTYIF